MQRPSGTKVPDRPPDWSGLGLRILFSPSYSLSSDGHCSCKEPAWLRHQSLVPETRPGPVDEPPDIGVSGEAVNLMKFALNIEH